MKYRQKRKNKTKASQIQITQTRSSPRLKSKPRLNYDDNLSDIECGTRNIAHHLNVEDNADVTPKNKASVTQRKSKRLSEVSSNQKRTRSGVKYSCLKND